MRTKRELYQEAMRTVALRRQAARANAEDARAEAEAAIPALRHAEEEVRVRGVRCALAGASGGDRTAAAAALTKAKQELAALLASSGRPADALEPKFTCKLCQDTGSVQGRTCTCVHKLMQGLRREEIEALHGTATMPTLLPGAAFFLGMSYPPAREMIGAGLGVALASDYNPGSSPSGNMRMVVSLASIRMKMTPAEAINAATLNGAYAMGLSRDYGSITLGKVANFFITKPMPSVEFFSYAYQTPLIRRVFLKGSEFPVQA